MAPTRLIAGFAGPVLLAIGIAMLLNRRAIMGMAAEIAQSTGLIFLSGIILLTAGIAIVRTHNVWSGGWPIIITVLGGIPILWHNVPVDERTDEDLDMLMNMDVNNPPTPKLRKLDLRDLH